MTNAAQRSSVGFPLASQNSLSWMDAPMPPKKTFSLTGAAWLARFKLPITPRQSRLSLTYFLRHRNRQGSHTANGKWKMVQISVPLHIKALHVIAPKTAKRFLVNRIVSEERVRAEARIKHMQSPAVEVPSLLVLQDVGLSQLDYPDMQCMVDRLNKVFHDGTNAIWEQSADLAKSSNPNEFLGLHPNVSISKALRQILGSAFPDNLYLEIDTYLMDHEKSSHGRPKVYREERVRYMYTMLRYLEGCVETTCAIEQSCSFTTNIKSLRLQVSRAKALYDPTAKPDYLKRMARVRFSPFENLMDTQKTIHR